MSGCAKIGRDTRAEHGSSAPRAPARKLHGSGLSKESDRDGQAGALLLLSALAAVVGVLCTMSAEWRR